MNALQRIFLAGTVVLLAWVSDASAYNFYAEGGFLGYTYNKWGDPALGTKAKVYWSIMPAGTPGSAYCATACTSGTGVSSLALPNFYDWNTHSFRSVNLTDAEVLGYIRAALRAWSAATGVTFVYLPGDSGVPINDPAAEPPPAGATGQIRIGVFDFGYQGNAGVGYAPPPNGFEPNSSQLATGAGDILLNSEDSFQNPAGAEATALNAYPQGGGPFLNDLQGLILHEIGHALGLDHSAVADAVMCGYISGYSITCTYDNPSTYVINRELSADDIAGAQVLYGLPVDTDGDGVPDAIDNCINVANADQRDTDGDGYGNACDADLNNDGVVNFADLSLFKTAFGTTNANADLDGNGNVNFTDLSIFKGLFGKAPGPSGFHPTP